MKRLDPGAVPVPAPSVAGTGLQLSELIGTLGHALDISEGQPKGHCVLCCCAPT